MLLARGNAQVNGEEHNQTLHSLAGYVVVTGELSLTGGEKARVDVLGWKSHTQKEKALPPCQPNLEH